MVQIAFNGARFTCHPCWQRADRSVRAQLEPKRLVQPVPDEPDNQQARVPEIHLPLGPFSLGGHSRASNTSRHCIFISCRNAPSHSVPVYVKLDMVRNHNFYIPSRARVCDSHFRNNLWEEQMLQGNHHDFNSDYMLDIINIYKWGLERKQGFENLESRDNDEFHFWTCLTKNQFNNILEQTPSLRARSRNPATVLGIISVKSKDWRTQ